MLKIGYFADGPWAHKAFLKLQHDQEIDICFICVRYETKDLVLQEYAKENEIDYLYHQNINSEEFLNILYKYKIDLIVSMSFNQIFKEEILNIPPMGAINCHAGKLPFYRGRNILNWVLINDEKEFGITVHYIDEGIDTGDIILQDTFVITDEDNYATLLEKAYIGCADILYRAICAVRENSVKRIKQTDIDEYGMYCGMRRQGDEMLDWNQSSRAIFNFIRSICTPGPQATTTLNGKELKINKAVFLKGHKEYIGIPGQILIKTKEWLLVKTKDTALLVTEYTYDGTIRAGNRFWR